MRLLKLAQKVLKADDNEVVGNSSNRINKMVINLFNQSKNNKSGNLTYMSNIEAMEKFICLIFNYKKILNHL